jgi:kinesin family protein 16B
MATKICVAVRVRPLNDNGESELFYSTPYSLTLTDKRHGSENIVVMQDTRTSITNPVTNEQRTFSFDHSIWSCSPKDAHYRGQEYVFENLGTQLLNNAFDGYNACLFAYGQTGSGKPVCLSLLSLARSASHH